MPLSDVLPGGKLPTRGASSSSEWLQRLGRMPPDGIRCASTIGSLCLGGGEHLSERRLLPHLTRSNVNHGQHRAKVRDVGGFEMLTKERTIELLRDDRLTWAD